MSDQATPICWRNLPGWAGRTARMSWRDYQSKPRSLSIHRCWRLLWPNLRQPIFLLGAPRSGTTFLGSCLAALPEVSYHFEPVATKAAARYVAEGLWRTSKARHFYRTVYKWLMRIHLDGDLRFAEKTPRNAFLVAFLHETFPDAQFIHIVRDGRDAALSHSKTPWLQATSTGSSRRETGGYPFGPEPRFWVEPERVGQFRATTDIHRCIWAWRRHTEGILQQAAKLPRAQYHQIRYETLVQYPGEQADGLLDYLRITDQQSRRRLHQVARQADPGSVGTWRRELSDDQLAVIMAEAAPLLADLGYLKDRRRSGASGTETSPAAP